MEKKSPRKKEAGVPRVERFQTSCERLKKLDLKELLEREYGLIFRREGNSYVALSPFQSETRPSFYVRRLDDGHWVFKDHSADEGGTIFDFVRRREGLASFAEVYQRTALLAAESGMGAADPVVDPEPANSGSPDLEWLLERFRQADSSICAEYLERRGVAASLIDRLLASGTVTLNAYRGHSHCCFAVRDRSGRLRGLFNRRIDGDGKFLLGERTVFSLDWERLAQARSVFVCEGIIDYLSLKTLEGADAVGVALLGGHVDPELRGLLPEAELIAAFDADEAGRKTGEQLRSLFPDRVVRDYDLLGHHDPNELLTAGGRGVETTKGSHKLTPERRARIAFDSRPSRDIAAELGLHHSTVCEIREDAQRILRDTWAQRRPGPKPAPPEDGRIAAARDEGAALREKIDLGRMRNDWLELQLKWHRRREEEERRQDATQKKNDGKTTATGEAPKEKEEKIALVNQHAKEYPERARSVRLKQVDLTESRYRRLREGVERRRCRESAIPPEDVAAGVDFFVRRPEVGAGKAHDALVDSEAAWVSAASLNETKNRLADAAAEEHERRRARSKLEQETKARLRLSMNKAETYTHITPTAPNEIWATDFLHIRFLSFDFYLCVVYDVFSQRCLALIPGDYPDSDLAAKAIREARRKSGTSPKRYLIFDNGKAFLSKDYQDILRLLGTTPRVLPPHSPWFNGSLEANNRTLRSTIVSVGVQTLADTGADTLRLRQNRGQALNALNDFCAETSRILNDEIPRPKFHVTPSTVMAGGTSEAQERHRRFIEHKKQQRKERMRKIRDGDIKTGRESLAEKAVKAARKAVRALSHDRLFALNELLCGRSAAFTV